MDAANQGRAPCLSATSMIASWRFVLAMAPLGKGRPRACIRGIHASVYTPRASAEWEHFAALTLRTMWSLAPLDCPVGLDVVAVCARPQRLLIRRKRTGEYTSPKDRLWRPSKPDGDNVLKAVIDAIQKAGIVVDDKQIVDIRIRSVYAAIEEYPRVELSLWRIDNASMEDAS